MSDSPKTVLVTGGAGFIGSHTSVRLLERGDRVVIIDNMNDYYDPARKRANLEDVRAAAPSEEALTFVEGDIRDRELLDRLGELADRVSSTVRGGLPDRIVNVAGPTVFVRC